jgi:hypothetical protein
VNIEWNAIFFTILEDRLPTDAQFDREFMEYAASNIIFTGLACTSIVNSGQLAHVVQKTRQKVEEFQQVIARDRTPLAASILRARSFDLAYRIKDYRSPPQLIQDDESARAALKIWRMARAFAIGESIVGHSLSSLRNFAATQGAMERLLRSNMERVRKLAALPVRR